MNKLLNVIKGKKDDTNQVLNRSTYSLVSCGDLTPDTLQSWIGLPEEVKSDPSLEQIRKKFEEIGRGNEFKNKSLQHVIPESVLQTEEDSGDVQNESKNYDEKVNNTHGRIIAKPSKIKEAKWYTKMTVLLGCWVFFTSIFLMYNEKEQIFKNTAVVGGEDKYYPLDVSSNKVELKLSGPFLSEQAEWKIDSNDSISYLMVWVVCGHGTFEEESEAWRIALENKTDLNSGELRTKVFDIKKNCTMRLRTDEKLVPFTMSYKDNPLLESTGVMYAVILLCGLYVLIIFEIINRTMAAMLISTTSLAVLSLVGERPSLYELVSWLDVETLLLLFSMMILVSIVAETGLFDYLAVFTFEVTKGKLWPLIYLLCIITAVLSTFLDNVTTILLISPVTIRLCEVMDLDPVPILMLMAMYSNIGGTATPVGDPPNVIVASNKAVVQAGINFTNFTAHMALGILVVVIQTSLQVRFMFRDTNKLRIRVPREIQDLQHQITIWRRAADSLPHLSNGVNLVRERLEKKINKLTLNLEKLLKDSKKRACSKDTFVTTLVELKAKYKIRDKKLLIKSSVGIAFVVVVFFMHSIPELNRVSLGWTALLGALLLLTLADRADLEPILHRVEWSTLLFFASLFVLMEALSKLGLISYIGGLMEQLIYKVDERYRLAVALMLILWASGAISAFVDNIPLTTMMVRVVVSLGSNPALALPLPPLVWALLLGACLGGNGTLIGASANVVCAGVAEQHGYRFTFMQFFKIGFPLMIGHFVVASGYLLLCHCVFQWH